MTDPLLLPMFAHIALTAFLYFALTVVRAPKVWGIGAHADEINSLAGLESKISANLSNQFEWPLFFYAICVLLISSDFTYHPAYLWLAWIFVGGRLIHSCVQVFSSNIRLRGIVFTINFLAVLGMWGLLVFGYLFG